ncbi:MAG: response regulator [Gammaproteobacteria bacterium]|nr:response regulator [Gammaproteobacteria bacterium]
MTKKKVLVCDDSATDLKHLSAILQSAGCEVLCVQSGEQAILTARSERPEIIFLDIIMPDMDGFEACRMINEDPEIAHIPVIFVSSKDQLADRVWGKIQGAHDFIVKPYTAEQILGHL